MGSGSSSIGDPYWSGEAVAARRLQRIYGPLPYGKTTVEGIGPDGRMYPHNIYDNEWEDGYEAPMFEYDERRFDHGHRERIHQGRDPRHGQYDHSRPDGHDMRRQMEEDFARQAHQAQRLCHEERAARRHEERAARHQYETEMARQARQAEPEAYRYERQAKAAQRGYQRQTRDRHRERPEAPLYSDYNDPYAGSYQQNRPRFNNHRLPIRGDARTPNPDFGGNAVPSRPAAWNRGVAAAPANGW